MYYVWIVGAALIGWISLCVQLSILWNQQFLPAIWNQYYWHRWCWLLVYMYIYLSWTHQNSSNAGKIKSNCSENFIMFIYYYIVVFYDEYNIHLIVVVKVNMVKAEFAKENCPSGSQDRDVDKMLTPQYYFYSANGSFSYQFKFNSNVFLG